MGTPVRMVLTGAGGALGQAAARRFLDEGVALAVVVRAPDSLPVDIAARAARVVVWDIGEPMPQEARAALAVHAPEVVVHAAALSTPFAPASAFQRINVDGTRRVIDWALSSTVARFVFVSSPSVLQIPADRWNLTEDAAFPDCAMTAYAAGKIESEGDVDVAFGLGAVIVRPRAVYGRGDRVLLPRLVEVVRRGVLPRFRSGEVETEVTHADDVADGLWRAATYPSALGGVFTLAGERTTAPAIARAVAALKGWPLREPRVPYALAWGLASGAEWAARLRNAPEPRLTRHAVASLSWTQTHDTSRARTLLGWFPTRRWRDAMPALLEGWS